MRKITVYGDSELWKAVSIRLPEWIAECRSPADIDKDPSSNIVLWATTEKPALNSLDFHLAAGSPVAVVPGDWLTRDACERLSASGQAGLFEVVNPDRYLPSRDAIRQQIVTGKLGDPGLIRSHRWESTVTATDNKLPSPLIADLELVTWLIDQAPQRVFAAEAQRANLTGGVARTIQVHTGYRNGAMALIDYSGALSSGTSYQSLSVIGSAGAAYADDHQNMQLLFQEGPPRAVLADENVRRWTNLARDLFVRWNAATASPPGVTAWQRALQVSDAVLESLRTGQAVVLEGR